MRKALNAKRFATAEVHPSMLVVKNAIHFIVSNGGQMTISQLLPLFRQHAQFNFLNIGKLLKILQSYHNVFDLVDTGKGMPQIQASLAFELKICEQPRQCGGYPRCKNLHICKYFIQNKCRGNQMTCHCGHDLHSVENFQILQGYGLERLEPLVVKEWLQKHHNKKSRPLQVCTYYNTARGCSRNERCPFLHLCSYFVKGRCKFGHLCARSHDLYWKRNSEILREHGIDLRCDQYQVLGMLSKRTLQRGYKRYLYEHSDPVDLFSNSDTDDEDGMTPGKPFLVKASSNCITIHWKHVPHLSSEFKHHIQYKEMPEGQWTSVKDLVSHDASQASVSGLKSSSSYSFRVRLVDDKEGEEYPFSLESSVFKTLESPP
ncbi:zinc finger CCCH-type antiviral protein 1-like isoform X2 [Saccostrea echinata]|nr:zinc finger CCCH-type antiviral protein 1-like isoform X2 [Saccostrea echinata]XP_061178075.1 zinc finger CCCH-type antiviral protein 1-like isoform X2 [Saccostrea echinata]